MSDAWPVVQDRIRALADRIEAGTPSEPVRFQSVLDIAYELSEGDGNDVLTGIVAVMPSTYDGETYRDYAERLREAVTR
ncbi:hypothetical protein [Streptomyces sp. AMCC400023]|uniref:hypothetical protein n=1 Tax=Streptomyces sp. AMCC400023 TaxID=2056258 RepID=UPI001F3C1D14|nr:hypothetical protein [Streptomyces sp. AMCC400023]UJV42948.1 hypothetical protein CVT30_26675 [Streptomyces sp. AMCC400023]